MTKERDSSRKELVATLTLSTATAGDSVTDIYTRSDGRSQTDPVRRFPGSDGNDTPENEAELPMQ